MRTPATAKRLWSLDTPTMAANASDLVVGAAPAELRIPISTYLIEHPHGLIVFDTGLAPEAYDDPVLAYGDRAQSLRFDIAPDQRLDRQLASLGYSVDAVTHVVSSHAHWDHFGSAHLFTSAKHYIGAGEFNYAWWPAPHHRSAYRLKDLEATRSLDWHEVPGIDVDLFGDGSLVILSTPGHTPGGLSLLVRLPTRSIVLTGDAAHLQTAFDREAPMPRDTHPLDAVGSIRRLKLLCESTGALLWVGHDPGEWTAGRRAPHCYE